MRETAETDNRRERDIVAGVRASGLKMTPQRLAIVRELAADESHPTAQELWDRLRPAMPTMSFATVYNTLAALSSVGLCVAMSLQPGSGRFDPNIEPHDHIVCDACGAVRDLPLVARPAPGPADRAAARGLLSGFALRSVEQIFRGLCASCARTSRGSSKGRKPRTTREGRIERSR